MRALHEVSSHFLRVIVILFGLKRTEQFYGSIFSCSLWAQYQWLARGRESGDLLVEIEGVDVALLVGQLDVAKVLLELDVEHILGHSPVELVRLDVHFHFGFLIAPGELSDFLLDDDWRGSCSLGPFVSAVRLDQDWVASVDLAICFEVLSSLSREVLGRVGVVILQSSRLATKEKIPEFPETSTGHLLSQGESVFGVPSGERVDELTEFWPFLAIESSRAFSAACFCSSVCSCVTGVSTASDSTISFAC